MVNGLGIICINLARRPDRLLEFMEQAEAANLQVDVVPAVDGLELKLDEVVEYRGRLRRLFFDDLKAGEVACCLSHLKAYRAFLETEMEYCLILEDDACLPPDLIKFLEELFLKLKDARWDAIRLQRSRKQNGPVLFVVEGNEVIYPLRVGLKTTACLYTRDGARKAARVYEKFYLPADQAMKFAHLKGLLMYEVNPTLIEQRNCSSDIGGGNQDPKTPSLFLRVLYYTCFKLGQALRLLWLPYVLFIFRGTKIKGGRGRCLRT